MEWTLGQKTTAVQELSYLHVSRLKKRNGNREKQFCFWNLVLLKGSTFHLNDKKSDKGSLTDGCQSKEKEIVSHFYILWASSKITNL